MPFEDIVLRGLQWPSERVIKEALRWVPSFSTPAIYKELQNLQSQQELELSAGLKERLYGVQHSYTIQATGSRAEVRAEVKAKVDAAATQLPAEERRLVTNASIELFCRELEWEYGDEEIFPVWYCLRFGALYVTYCEMGHGPEHPWGVVQEDERFVGPDSCWFPDLAGAVRLAHRSSAPS
jgi:hypothetical protein